MPKQLPSSVFAALDSGYVRSEVGPHDFLTGRGGATNKHPGSVAFRDFLKAFAEAYGEAAGHSAKQEIVWGVIEFFEWQGGHIVCKFNEHIFCEVDNAKKYQVVRQKLSEAWLEMKQERELAMDVDQPMVPAFAMMDDEPWQPILDLPQEPVPVVQAPAPRLLHSVPDMREPKFAPKALVTVVHEVLKPQADTTKKPAACPEDIKKPAEPQLAPLPPACLDPIDDVSTLPMDPLLEANTLWGPVGVEEMKLEDFLPLFHLNADSSWDDDWLPLFNLDDDSSYSRT